MTDFSTAMPKPPANATRAIKPPAPRVAAKPAAKTEAVPKKPAARTQSQPRPNAEAKNVSQPTTPKVYRKIVTVSSKIGSFTDHKPQGGNVQIFSENRTYNAQSKIGSLHNVSHTPGGGNVKIPNMKLDFKEKAKPKIEAKSDYVPPVPEKKMITQKLNWNAQSKIGSLDNVKHKPAGGNVQILNQKLEWHATSKVGSKDNIKHKPGGGNVQPTSTFINPCTVVGVDGSDPSTTPKSTRCDRAAHDGIRGFLLKRRGGVACFSSPWMGHQHRRKLYIDVVTLNTHVETVVQDEGTFIWVSHVLRGFSS
ncbi:hypothetical protein Y032_0609g611 [Ancylostoma ceylanicum]|uniref:Microtubule-associated protein n=2 Tax=Ancylostoma ceylanicum TaxID=53326 RepID=A0A016WLN8_9BILA|nr:hypothetical protein Y032_0609g611 [Ancylostoma ceylanicum]